VVVGEEEGMTVRGGGPTVGAAAGIGGGATVGAGAGVEAGDRSGIGGGGGGGGQLFPSQLGRATVLCGLAPTDAVAILPPLEKYANTHVYRCTQLHI
jgi:hypothetical protein